MKKLVLTLVLVPSLANAAISFVASAFNSANNGADVTVTLPTGSMLTNDLIIVAYSIGDNDSVALNTAMITAGYTEVVDIDRTDDAEDSYLGVFWKLWNGSDTTAVVDGLGGTDASVAAVVMVFRGVDTATPMDVAATTNSGIDSAHPDPLTIDWSTANTWVVIAGGSAHLQSSEQTYTFPTGYTTNAVDDSQTGSETTYTTVGLAYNSAPSDPENPGTMTHSSTAATNSWTAGTLALREYVAPICTAGLNLTLLGVGGCP